MKTQEATTVAKEAKTTTKESAGGPAHG